jgi:hypothetical protein
MYDVSARLLRAYRLTTYEGGGVEVRIGRRPPGLDCLMRRYKTRQAVFITAWNPLSRRKPENWNRRMQDRLLARLRHDRSIAAGGELGRWREEHVLIFGDPRRGLVLARQFRQRGFVVVSRGSQARLRLLDY